MPERRLPALNEGTGFGGGVRSRRSPYHSPRAFPPMHAWTLFDRFLVGRRVRQNDHAGFEGLRTEQPQRPGRSGLGEQALAAAKYEWVNPDPVLVDQAVLHQRLHERRAAIHLDALAGLGLQAGDLAGDITLDQPGIPIQWFGQCPGGDELGDAVHPLEVWSTLDLAPGLGHQLVRHPSAQEIITRHQVLVRVLTGFLVEVRAGPAALLGLAEATRILDHTIECDQRRHAELPHSDLLEIPNGT